MRLGSLNPNRSARRSCCTLQRSRGVKALLFPTGPGPTQLRCRPGLTSNRGTKRRTRGRKTAYKPVGSAAPQSAGAPSAVTQPWCSTVMRSESESTRSMSCSISSTVWRMARSRMSASMRSRSASPSPASGSSSSSKCGPVASATAISSSRCSPCAKLVPVAPATLGQAYAGEQRLAGEIVGVAPERSAERRARLYRDAHRLEYTKVAEHAHDLKRAGNPCIDARMRGSGTNVASAKPR